MLNTVCFNRILGFFGDFWFDYFVFSSFAILNKAVYIYYWHNSLMVNCFLTFLELLEYRRYGNLSAFLLVFSLLISKSLLQVLGRTSKRIKGIVFTSVFAVVSGFLIMQVDLYLVNLADLMQERIVKNLKIDWIGIFEGVYFNCFQVRNKIEEGNFTINNSYGTYLTKGLISCKNSIFIESYLIRELLKYLIKLKLSL